MELTNLEKAKRAEIYKALVMFDWNVSKACKHVGMSRATFYRISKRYKLNKDEL